MSAIDMVPIEDIKLFHTPTASDMTQFDQSFWMETPRQPLAHTFDQSNRTTLQEVLGALSMLVDDHPELYSQIEDTLTGQQNENQSTASQQYQCGVHYPVYNSHCIASEPKSSLEHVKPQQPCVFQQNSMSQPENCFEAELEQFNDNPYHQQFQEQSVREVIHPAARNLSESFGSGLQCPYCHTMFNNEHLRQGHIELCEQSMFSQNTHSVPPYASGYFGNHNLVPRLDIEEQVGGNTSPSYSSSSSMNLSSDSNNSEVMTFELPRRGRPSKVSTRGYSTRSKPSAFPSKNTNGLFVCGLCDAKFTFHTNLTRHQRKLHGKPCTRGRGAHH